MHWIVLIVAGIAVWVAVVIVYRLAVAIMNIPANIATGIALNRARKLEDNFEWRSWDGQERFLVEAKMDIGSGRYWNVRDRWGVRKTQHLKNNYSFLENALEAAEELELEEVPKIRVKDRRIGSVIFRKGIYLSF
jgi:hypothetical protein